MDIAKRKDGDWMIVELGDAQVAGLPENADALKFYRGLKEGYRQEKLMSTLVLRNPRPACPLNPEPIPKKLRLGVSA